MNASDWLMRFLCLLITFGSAWVKHEFYQPVATLLDVGLSLCLSGICNAVAVVSAALLVRGGASYDLQRLAECALVVNFLSFIAFAAKTSPMVHFLNLTITVISYVQLVRLLWPSNGGFIDFCRRLPILRIASLQRARLHFSKEN